MSGSAFARSVDVFLSRELSPQAMSAALARVAEAGTAELIRSGRASPRFRRFVDGVEGAPAASVKPDGVIVDRFVYLADAAAFALAYLQARSPEQRVRQGPKHNTPARFRDSFFLGMATDIGGGGKFVEAKRFNPEAVTADVAEIIIGNTQPFNRLVDVQLEGSKRIHFSVPADLYSDAGQAVTRRFGSLVNAFRRYNVRFPGQYALKVGRGGKPVQSPALVIQVRV